MNSIGKKLGKQSGMTLMEILASLAILASIIVGALSLFGAASSSQISTQASKDLMAFRTSIQQLYLGQGGYGANVSLNTTLSTSGKVPSSFTYVAANTNFNTSWGGTLSIEGTSANFTMTLTKVTSDVCIALVTGLSSGWTSLTVNATSVAATPAAFSVPLALASTNCTATDQNTLVWTTVN